MDTLDPHTIPTHVAIIPDGNRRWAKRKAAQTADGHREGGDNLIPIVRAAGQMGIKVMTLYLFSTENWTRDSEEVETLMALQESFLHEQQQTMIDEGVRFHTIGDLKRLPLSFQRAIQTCKEATAHCKKIDMIAALNYGARDEICRAVKRLIQEAKQGILNSEEVTEPLLSSYLDTAAWSDPELLIRSSGEMRLSNFLLWQLSYSEIYVTDVLWPDFRPSHLVDAVKFYQTRQRRLGGP